MPSASVLCEAIDLKQYEWPVPLEGEDCWFIINPRKGKWKSIQKTQPLFSKDKPLHFALVSISRSVEYNDSFFKNLHNFIIDHADRLKSIVLYFAHMFPCHPTTNVSKPSFLDEWDTMGAKFDKLEYLLLGDPSYKVTKRNKEQICRFMPYNLKKIEMATAMARVIAKVKTISTEPGTEDGTIPISLVARKASKIVAEEAAEKAKVHTTNLKLTSESIQQIKERLKSIEKKITSGKDQETSEKEHATLLRDLANLHAKRSKIEGEAKMKADIYSKIAHKIAPLRGKKKSSSSSLVSKSIARFGKEKKNHLLFLTEEMVANMASEVVAEMEVEMAAKKSFLNLKHFALLGVDSERTMHKILTFAIEKNGKQDLNCIMHVSSGKTSEIMPWRGTPYHILQSFSYYSHEGNYVKKKPREYEYALLAKLVYSFNNNAEGTWLKGLKVRNGVFGIKPLVVAGEEEEIPKEMPDFFWLTMRGWRCVKFIHESFWKGANYTGAVLINKYTQQIVLATRGTEVDFKNKDIGAITSDIVGVVMGLQSGQHKSARKFLHHLLADIKGTSTDPILDESIFGKIKLVPRCRPGDYNAIEEGEESHTREFNLSFTGHSLGGWLSEVLIAEACLKGYYTSSVSFDSPGAESMIKRLLPRCNTTDLDCVGFVGSPNLVNTCNKHVGEIKSILTATPSAIASLQSLGNDLLEWVANSLAFHSSDNFIKAGSRFQKNLVAATVVGEWPVSLRIFGTNAIFIIISFCKGHYKYLANTGLQHFRERLALQEKVPLAIEEWHKSSEEIREVAKGNRFSLELREFYSFPLVRLYPNIQQLVKIYTSFSIHTRAEISNRILPEFSNLMEPIKDLTHNGIVIVKEEMGIHPVKVINKLNSFDKALVVVSNHSEAIVQQVSIEHQIKSFVEYLFALLASPQSLKASLPSSGRKSVHVVSNAEEKIGEESEEKEFGSIEELKKHLSSPEGQRTISSKEKQNFISRHFKSILKKAVEKAREKLEGRKPEHEEFAILALGSWGRDCPLPNGTPKKLYMITKTIPESSMVEFANFWKEIRAECANAGISCQNTMIPCSKEEIFRFYVLGPHASSKEYPPREKKDINGCLLRLCAIWDSNCVFGNKNLVEQFKDLFESIMDAIDENGFRRDRQFMESFFYHIQSKVQSKEEEMKTNGEKEVKIEEVRSVFLDLFNIITFLSLFDRVRATNPWERIQDIIAKGTVSEKLGSQLLCCWNVVHTLYLNGTLPSDQEVHAGSNSQEGKEEKESNKEYQREMDGIAKKIFFFVKTDFIKEMGGKCGTFLTSLDSFSGKNPFYKNIFDLNNTARYYACQAKNSELSLETADLWDQVFLHKPSKDFPQERCVWKRMVTVENWPNPQEYRLKVEKKEKMLAAISPLDRPLSPAGSRLYAIEEQKTFVNYLQAITDHTGDLEPKGKPYTYYGEYGPIEIKGNLIYHPTLHEGLELKEDCVALDFLEFHKAKFNGKESFVIPIPGSEEILYRCYVYGPDIAIRATNYSLNIRISGNAIPCHIVKLGCINGPIIVFKKEIRSEERSEPLPFTEALSVPLQIQYSLQFLQNLILLPYTRTMESIRWPTQTGERDPLAFSSNQIVAPEKYGYTHSALIEHPQFEVACSSEAIRIFLYLSPHQILRSWTEHNFRVQGYERLNSIFILAMYYRFRLLQQILKAQDFDSPLSHVEILMKMPDVILQKGQEEGDISTFEYCLPRWLYRGIEMHQKSDGKGNIALEAVNRMYKLLIIEDNAIRDKLYDRDAENDMHDVDWFSHVKLLSEFPGGVYYLSFKYLLLYHIEREPFKEEKILKKYFEPCLLANRSTMRILDCSNTQLKEFWLQTLCQRIPLQTLILNNTKLTNFMCENIFSNLVSLSLESCPNLRKAILEVDEMRFLQFVSFNDSSSFSTLKIPSLKYYRKYPLHISMLRTSVTWGISDSLGLPPEIPVFENGLLQNHPEENNRFDHSPVYLQIEENTVHKKSKGRNFSLGSLLFG